jgi:hypothetical protein
MSRRLGKIVYGFVTFFRKTDFFNITYLSVNIRQALALVRH